MEKIKILLASGSPRRIQLLQALDYSVRQIVLDYEEKTDDSVSVEKIPESLAISKMKRALPFRNEEDAVITADTVVLLEGKLLQKPASAEEAREHLRRLSNTRHKVITAVSITTSLTKSFSTVTQVWMDPISEEDIDYYIKTYRPMDKAGAYGIQEWIGWSHIRKIEGSFANVMGLPTREVYRYLSANLP